MLGKIRLIVLFALCVSFTVIKAGGHDASYEIIAVYGTTPTIDGFIDPVEWSDAASVLFNNTEVFVKQDGVNLYIGFNNSEAPYYEEDDVFVLIDVNCDGSSTLQPDDIALGVLRNGNLVEGNVTGGYWNFINVSGWNGDSHSTPTMWQAEFNITYSKINVVAGVEKTIGVVLGCLFKLVQSYPFCWPPKYYPDIYDDPSEWGGIISTGYNWIPEFPSVLILPLLMIISLIAFVLKKLLWTKKHQCARNFF